ncbi:MAG: amidohydrolase family protein [Candidatus Hydrogenedentes bacterium]|nr:amidohydrolase family protein [Candidatus Hydrogenedentota bacterium]
MFIDIHVHVRKRPGAKRRGKQAYATPEHLIERYDAIGVEQAVLLPGVNPECSYTPQSNEEVLEICEAYPGRFIPFCNLDPRAMTNSADAPLGDILSHYRDCGCKGIGEVAANLPFLHPLVQNLFKHVEAVGFPLTFHIGWRIGGVYGLYDDPGLPQLEHSLAVFPNLRFLGHSQAFWAEMAPLETPGDRRGYPPYPVATEGVVPRLMRRYPNLYGDLSAGSGCNALSRDPEYAVRFLDEFQDRLLFGTDICAPDTPTPLVDFLLELRESGRISEAVFNKIARENAVKLLGLDG